MLNATVRAAATALPAAIFDRRRMLLGLAAASTAAAGPVAVAATTPRPVPAEVAELLDLGAKTAFVLANYRQAREAREAIVREWGPRWPEVPESIVSPSSEARHAPTLEDDAPIFGKGTYIWKRETLLESIAFIAEPQTFRKNAKPERIAKTRAWWAKLKAERETSLAALDAYHAQCADIRRASGIRPAQAAEDRACEALLVHVRSVMALEPATMAGVVIQAEALAAVAHVPNVARTGWRGNAAVFHEGYGERIAASILRIAGNA